MTSVWLQMQFHIRFEMKNFLISTIHHLIHLSWTAYSAKAVSHSLFNISNNLIRAIWKTTWRRLLMKNLTNIESKNIKI